MTRFFGFLRHLSKVSVFGPKLLHWIREVVFTTETKYNPFTK